MADQTKIEWTDVTWNPTSGCTRASEGCDNCYAVRMTKRLEVMTDASKRKYSGLVNPGKDHFNGVVRCHEDELLTPLRWRKPRRIFAGSMSDIFHKDVPFEFIDRIMAVVALCPQHTFQMLTKRPERMVEYFAQYDPERVAQAAGELAWLKWGPLLSSRKGGWIIDFLADNEGLCALPLSNLWLGTSVENQEQADARIPHLLEVPAAVRFLSCEPLLGRVDLTTWLWGKEPPCSNCPKDADCECGWKTAKDNGCPCISWVICGGESGRNARPMHPDWARSLRDQCVAAGVPFFFKQWGELVTEDQSPEDIILPCTSTRYFAVPKNKSDRDYMGGDQTDFYKVGKKAAGRLLDGRTWDEFPEVGQ